MPIGLHLKNSESPVSVDLILFCHYSWYKKTQDDMGHQKQDLHPGLRQKYFLMKEKKILASQRQSDLMYTFLLWDC